jgi:hypothetical protein
MARAFLRLRPDGIHEIVSQQRRQKLAFTFAALLVASTLGLVLAAALSASVTTARGLLLGAALAGVALFGWLVRSWFPSGASPGPVATTIRLRAASPHGPRPPQLPDSARDTGA